MGRQPISDEQFVEGVRRIQPFRRTLGSVVAVLGVTILLFGLAEFIWLAVRVKELFDETEPGENLYTLLLGGLLGAVLGLSLIGGAVAIGLGMIYRRPDRTSELLIRCWDELAANRASASNIDPDFS